MSSRNAILKRVRAAIEETPAWEEVPRDYRRQGELSREECLLQFEDRLEDYNAKILRCGSSEIAATVARAMGERGKESLVVPPGLPREWQPASVSLIEDTNLSNDFLDRCEGTLTACTAAISFTGSIVLTHSQREGRRAITLIPDYHLCVVHESQLYETVPEALEALRPHVRRPITTIAGPSATADIEMMRVKGVHGPRTLDVILVCD